MQLQKIWGVIDRGEGLGRLADHLDLPDAADADQREAARQGLLFDNRITATPAARTVGAA